MKPARQPLASLLLALSVMSVGAAHGQSGASPGSANDPPHRYGWPMRTSGTYVGWSGARWSRDYGVASGRCNRRDIAAIVLVPDGRGNLNPSVAIGYSRNVGTLRGASVGTLLGANYGADFDDQDRDCMGHALEIGKPGRSVSWLNPVSRISFAITPGKEHRSRQLSPGLKCREYIITIGVAGSAPASRPGVACQSEPGLWIIG